jgi:hypothetical protein
MSGPTPINRTTPEPTMSETPWYSGLVVLADEDRISTISLWPVEIAYAQPIEGRMYVLRITRCGDPAGEFRGQVERLSKSKDGGGWHSPRLMRETVRFAATPWEAANAASVAAGWVSAADLAQGRNEEATLIAWATRERARERQGRRHLKPVAQPTSEPADA